MEKILEATEGMHKMAKGSQHKAVIFFNRKQSRLKDTKQEVSKPVETDV